MNHLLHTVFDLLRLRAGPQDLPADPRLTGMVIVAYVAQAIFTSQALGGENEPTRSLMAIAIQFGAVAAMLLYRRNPERLQQTLMAFAATGIVVSLIAFGLLLQSDPQQNQPLLALFWFLIFGWSLAVDANIFRHALNVSMPIAMLITVMLLALTYLVLELSLR